MSRMHRGSTTPMDFEWQHQNGPVDERSPFLQGARETAKKRPHAVLDSPSKNTFSTPSRPQLRETASSSFASNGKPLPSIPSHVQSSKAWEPRTPASVYESSGGETPNTPRNDESDAATPDTHIASRMGQLMESERNKDSKKGRRGSIFNLRGMFSMSPTPVKEKSAPKRIENRVAKRRPKKARVARDEYDSDNEQQPAQVVPPAKAGLAAGMASFFSFLEAHPSLPSILSYYLQLSVNIILTGAALWVGYQLWASVQADVELEAGKNTAGIMLEISTCARNYMENNCQTPIPAMVNTCANWETCMNRDPKRIARAAVTAKTFATIINSFIEEFSYKSMIFTAIVIFGGFNISNWAFGLIRSKATPPHHDAYAYPPPPATPQRHPSGGYLDQHAQWGNATPFQGQHTPYMGHMLQASQSLPALPAPPTPSGQVRGGAEEERRDRRERSPVKRSGFFR